MRLENAIATFEEVGRRYGDREEGVLVVECAGAAMVKAHSTTMIDPVAGRRLFHAFVERFEGREEPEIVEFVEEVRRRLTENGA